MAFTKTFGDEEGSTQGAVLLDGFDAVIGAGGVEAAIGSDEGSDGQLIDPDEKDHAATT